MKKAPKGFELLFLTEGEDATPAAEILFDGQRLCTIREDSNGQPEIQFIADKYVLDHEVVMKFPLQEFNHIMQVAINDVHQWIVNLAGNKPVQPAA